MTELSDPAAEFLGKLGMELLARGMECELITTGCVPRLRLEIPWGWSNGRFTDSAFEDHVLAANFGDGQWRFWWPWIQPIAPVDDLVNAADHVIRDTLEFLVGGGCENRGDTEMTTPEAGASRQRPSCQSCELMRGLAGRLTRISTQRIRRNVQANS